MYLIIMSAHSIMILIQNRFQRSQLLHCAALEHANPKMLSKYICVTQCYQCLENVLELTLNTSAAKASVSAVPGASEVNDVVNHIMGILVLISWLCANLLCRAEPQVLQLLHLDLQHAGTQSRAGQRWPHGYVPGDSSGMLCSQPPAAPHSLPCVPDLASTAWHQGF